MVTTPGGVLCKINGVLLNAFQESGFLAQTQAYADVAVTLTHTHTLVTGNP